MKHTLTREQAVKLRKLSERSDNAPALAVALVMALDHIAAVGFYAAPQSNGKVVKK